MKIDAEFVTSAAAAEGLPRDGTPEVALIGRSNVGKSSLINALVRQTLARTSGAPGKTRLANVYRVARGAGAPLYLIDLPGFGFARGDRDELEAVTRAYFTVRLKADTTTALGAVLLVDARHPGLENDREAWRWVERTVERHALVATKIDKLARGERIRAMKTIESVFETSVLPVSAVTGEGLEELWRTIERLASPSSSPGPAAESPRPPRPRKN